MYLLHARSDQNLAHSAGVHQGHPAGKSVIGTVLAPNGPEVCYEDRIPYNHRAWGGRIGIQENIGIAIVFPIDHPEANPPEKMLQRTKLAAKQIFKNLNKPAEQGE